MMLVMLMGVTGAWAKYVTFEPSTEYNVPVTKDYISLQTTVEDNAYIICQSESTVSTTTITALLGRKITKIVMTLNHDSQDVVNNLYVSESCTPQLSMGSYTLTFTDKVPSVTLSMLPGYSGKIETSPYGLTVYYEDPEHQHEYSKEWSSDPDYHYHQCLTDDGTSCDEPYIDQAPHEYGQCIEGAAYYTCQTCGYVDETRKNETHSYTLTFHWADDRESCMATATCSCGVEYTDLVCSMSVSSVGVIVTYQATLSINGKDYYDTAVKAELHANQDPSYPSTGYYTTFYDSQRSYTLPAGVKAYAADFSNDEYADAVVMLTPIEGNILPHHEAVLLHSNTTGDMQLIETSEEGNRPEVNHFRGVDEDTEQAYKDYYMFSYGQYGLGFYRMVEGTTLAAHKAYLQHQRPDMAVVRAFRIVFGDGDVTGLDIINDDSSAGTEQGQPIYNLQGVRLSELQEGINIVNGKKVVVK